MSIIFYNIASIVLGVIIICYGIFGFIKDKKPLNLTLAIIHFLGLVATGIVGFMINEDYSYIIIVIMFALTIGYIIILITLEKNQKK